MNNKKKTETAFAKKVVGKKIVSVLYEKMGGELFPVLELDGEACLLIQRDDECNGPGVPVYFDKTEERGTGMWQLSCDLGESEL